jgi:hypothetical protein
MQTILRLPQIRALPKIKVMPNAIGVRRAHVDIRADGHCQILASGSKAEAAIRSTTIDAAGRHATIGQGARISASLFANTLGGVLPNAVKHS